VVTTQANLVKSSYYSNSDTPPLEHRCPNSWLPRFLTSFETTFPSHVLSQLTTPVTITLGNYKGPLFLYDTDGLLLNMTHCTTDKWLALVVNDVDEEVLRGLAGVYAMRSALPTVWVTISVTEDFSDTKPSDIAVLSWRWDIWHDGVA
jgi:hypothetical protein